MWDANHFFLNESPCTSRLVTQNSRDPVQDPVRSVTGYVESGGCFGFTSKFRLEYPDVRVAYVK